MEGFDFDVSSTFRDSLRYASRFGFLLSCYPRSVVGGFPVLFHAGFSCCEDRFNESCCRALFSNDPEYHRLLHLASVGAVVEVDPGFVPSPSPN